MIQYFEIEDTYYVLDMDALTKYIGGNDNEKIIEKTKNEQWMTSENNTDNELSLVSKEITETSSARKDVHAPFRAEIAKMMITLIMYPTINENGEAKEIKSFNEQMSLGQVIALNTLISEGIIKEIQVEEE